MQKQNNSGIEPKIERRIFKEAQQANKIEKIKTSQNDEISRLKQSKIELESSQNQILQTKDAEISRLKQLNSELEKKLTSSISTKPAAASRIAPSGFTYADLQRQQSPANTPVRPLASDLNYILSTISSTLSFLNNMSPQHVSSISIGDYARSLGDAKNRYFLFVDKSDMTKYLVGYDMQFTKYYAEGSKLDYTKAIQFSSIWGRVTYCSISKLEDNYLFIPASTEQDKLKYKLLFSQIVEMRTHYKAKFNELFSETKKDFEDKADLNPPQERVDEKIRSFDRNYKELVPFLGFGGTRRRKRKTRRHATNKRRKGRREKRKLTKRR